MIEREKPEGRVSSQHQQLAVGDIQHLHHPEDERKPNCRKAVKASDEDAEDEALGNYVPVHAFGAPDLFRT